MEDKIVGQGITFDDVLLLPARSRVLPRDVNVATKFSRNIGINIPICSSAMDTVTESRLAIALAQEGGIGVIHKNMSVDEQAIEVAKVKRSESGIIMDPISLAPSATVKDARQLMRQYNISGIPVVDERLLLGIITRRDLKFHESPETPVSEVMTRENLVTAPFGTSLDVAQAVLYKNKVEKSASNGMIVEGDDNTIVRNNIKDSANLDISESGTNNVYLDNKFKTSNL